MTEFYITELDDRCEFGVPAIDEEVLDGNTGGCTNSVLCCKQDDVGCTNSLNCDCKNCPS